MVTTSFLAGAQRLNLNKLEAQASADGWLDADGFWNGPPDLEELLALATHAFGSSQAANEWLTKPVAGLDGQRTVDLLRSVQGAELAHDLLTRSNTAATPASSTRTRLNSPTTPG